LPDGFESPLIATGVVRASQLEEWEVPMNKPRRAWVFETGWYNGICFGLIFNEDTNELMVCVPFVAFTVRVQTTE